jgi:hypothetical protein
VEEVHRLLAASNERCEQLVLDSQKTQDRLQLVGGLEGEIERLNAIVRERISENEQLRNTTRVLEGRLAACSSATQKEFAAYEERAVGCMREQERLTAQLKHRLAEN